MERQHRTIKTIAERGYIPPIEAVFWYNMLPRSGQAEESLPHRTIFKCCTTATRRRESACLCVGRGRSLTQTLICAVHIIMEEWYNNLCKFEKQCVCRWHSTSFLDVRKIINVSEDGAKSDGQEDEAGSNMPGTETSLEGPMQSQRERCLSYWLDVCEISWGVWLGLRIRSWYLLVMSQLCWKEGPEVREYAGLV